MDDYERTMRARAAHHQLQAVDWYVWDADGARRFADLASAEQYTLAINGAPSCGRGASCADIAPHLCHREADGRITTVEGWLAVNDAAWYDALD